MLNQPQSPAPQRLKATIGLADLLTIGIGKSSSHMVGPMRAGFAFSEAVLDRGEPMSVSCELFGALALQLRKLSNSYCVAASDTDVFAIWGSVSIISPSAPFMTSFNIPGRSIWIVTRRTRKSRACNMRVMNEDGDMLKAVAEEMAGSDLFDMRPAILPGDVGSLRVRE